MSATTVARRIASGALMIALLAAAMYVYGFHERDYDKAYAPLLTYGAVGQVLDAGPFRVKVDKVTVATSVVDGPVKFSTPVKSEASTIFVAIDGRITATTDAVALPYVVLRGTDRAATLYGPSDKIQAPEKLTDVDAQPGYWITGTWLFEVPRSALGGLHLQVGNQTENDVPRGTFPHLGFEFNPGVDVDLGLNDPAALLAHAKVNAEYKDLQK